MAIGNAQFDAIMREYDNRRMEIFHKLEERKSEVYDFIPEYKRIDDAISDLAKDTAICSLNGDKTAFPKMKAQLDEYIEKKRKLLIDFHFPEDYLEPIYTCPDCKDTGYIDQQKCHCLKREILRAMYRQSNIEDVLMEENFDNLSYDYYSDSEIMQMRGIIETCKSFVNEFDDKYENILFMGRPGVGKTYLTNCIAKALLDNGYSVIYFTSFELFDTLAKYAFHRNEEDIQVENVHRDIFECDLLIIDDLGTENVNSFISSQLFLILNERDKKRRSTIISTNLSLGNLNDAYSERSFSRIFGNYRIIIPDIADIRMKKKRMS